MGSSISSPNVLKPVWEELSYREYREDPNPFKQEFWDILDNVPEGERVSFFASELLSYGSQQWFGYSEFKRLIKKYGKSNKQIAYEVEEFCSYVKPIGFIPGLAHGMAASTTHEIGVKEETPVQSPTEFYGYFADYDWVLFCSLFGKMINLPIGFPYYCRDLKQMLDEKVDKAVFYDHGVLIKGAGAYENFEGKLKLTKARIDYPKQQNEHNALADASWNLALYKFLQSF